MLESNKHAELPITVAAGKDDLEDTDFDGDRYAYDIDVKVVQIVERVIKPADKHRADVVDRPEGLLKFGFAVLFSRLDRPL